MLRGAQSPARDIALDVTLDVALEEPLSFRAASLPPAALAITAWLAVLFVFVSFWTWGQLAPSFRLAPNQFFSLLSDSASNASPASNEAELVPPDSSILSPLFTPQVLRWSDEILRWSDAHDLDPNLVATVMQIESCGYSAALSSAGAIGLFQVMPFHFEPTENPSDIDVNAARGLAYLARSLELANGQIDLALAGYNGGHGVIGRDPSSWAAETRRYVYWGSGILADIEAGSASSPTLASWLEAGGASLCAQANSFPAP